jgi:hypothetical protein
MSAATIAAYRKAEQHLANSELMASRTLIARAPKEEAAVRANVVAAQAKRDRLYALVADELAHNALVAEHERHKLGALGPEREVTPDKWVCAVMATDAALAADPDLSRDRDVALAGVHGEGSERERVRRDAAYLMWHAGDAAGLERLGVDDGPVRQLVYFELRHCGRPWRESKVFESYTASAEQLDRVPLADEPEGA